MILQKQLIEEIELIPAEKYDEIYDLIHYFRLGLMQEKIAKQETAKKVPQFGFAKGTFKLSDDFDGPLDDFQDYVH